MSLFQYKNVCEDVKFYSHHIDPVAANTDGVLTISNGHTAIPTVPDQAYTFTVDAASGELRISGQSSGPSPMVPCMAITPAGTAEFTTVNAGNPGVALNIGSDLTSASQGWCQTWNSLQAGNGNMEILNSKSTGSQGNIDFYPGLSDAVVATPNDLAFSITPSGTLNKGCPLPVTQLYALINTSSQITPGAPMYFTNPIPVHGAHNYRVTIQVRMTSTDITTAKSSLYCLTAGGTVATSYFVNDLNSNLNITNQTLTYVCWFYAGPNNTSFRIVGETTSVAVNTNVFWGDNHIIVEDLGVLAVGA